MITLQRSRLSWNWQPAVTNDPPTHAFASSLKFPADFRLFKKRNFSISFIIFCFSDEINSLICVQGFCLSRNSRQAIQLWTIEQFFLCFCLFAAISVWTFSILTMFESAQCSRSRVSLNPTTDRSSDYRSPSHVYICAHVVNSLRFWLFLGFVVFCPFSVWRGVLGESVVRAFISFCLYEKL